MLGTTFVGLPTKARADDADVTIIHHVEDEVIRQDFDASTSTELWRSTWAARQGQLTSPAEFDSGAQRRSAQADDGDPSVEVVYATDNTGIIQDRFLVSNTTAAVDNETGQMPFQWSAGSSTISLGWWSPNPSIKWTIRADDKIVATTTDTNIEIADVDRTTNAYYTVEGAQTVTMKNGTKAKQPFYYGVAFPAVDKTSLGRNIADPEVRSADANKDLVGFATSVNAMMEVNYTMFIADRYVGAPAACANTNNGNIAYYGGDNRSFDSGLGLPQPHRVSGGASLNFLNGKMTVDSRTSTIGTTIAYDSKYKELARKKAPTTDMSVGVTQNSVGAGKYAQILFSVDSANPLCKIKIIGAGAPAINGKITVTVHATGQMNASGNHDQAPNHEITYFYSGDRGTGTGCAYRRKIASFNHLLPPYPDAVVDVTWNAATGAVTNCTVR